MLPEPHSARWAVSDKRTQDLSQCETMSPLNPLPIFGLQGFRRRFSSAATGFPSVMPQSNLTPSLRVPTMGLIGGVANGYKHHELRKRCVERGILTHQRS